MIPGTQATIEWKWNESFCIYYADTGDIPPGYKLQGDVFRPPDASASNHEAVG